MVIMGHRIASEGRPCPSLPMNLKSLSWIWIRYQLRRSGRALNIEKIPMELLILLVSRNGDLVFREEIVEKLWGKDVFVETDHSVNTAVRKIRQTLSDDPDNPRFVKTIKGKGYRFDANIKFKSEGAAVPALSAPNGVPVIVTNEQESLSSGQFLPTSYRGELVEP